MSHENFFVKQGVNKVDVDTFPSDWNHCIPFHIPSPSSNTLSFFVSYLIIDFDFLNTSNKYLLY